MRLIDGDAFRDLMQRLAYDDWNQEASTSWADAFRECAQIVDAVPSVDAEPVRHGRWIAVKADEDDYKRICSCCGEEAPFDESEDVYLLYPHCPWCGASLDIKGGNGNG